MCVDFINIYLKQAIDNSCHADEVQAKQMDSEVD